MNVFVFSLDAGGTDGPTKAGAQSAATLEHRDDVP
jgi:hypothetical protein